MTFRLAIGAGLMLFAISCANKTKQPEQTGTKTAAAAPTAVAKAPSSVKPEEPAKTAPTEMSCQNGTDSRFVRIETASPKECKVLYSKWGSTESVATSSSGSEHCEKTVDKIKGNLEKAGYKCSNLTASKAEPDRKAASAK